MKILLPIIIIVVILGSFFASIPTNAQPAKPEPGVNKPFIGLTVINRNGKCSITTDGIDLSKAFVTDVGDMYWVSWKEGAFWFRCAQNAINEVGFRGLTVNTVSMNIHCYTNGRHSIIPGESFPLSLKAEDFWDGSKKIGSYIDPVFPIPMPQSCRSRFQYTDSEIVFERF